MKKLISIKDLQFGMFLDAEAVTEEKDGEEVKYLSTTNATGVGSAGKCTRLTGRMNEKITQDGGLLIGNDNIIVSLRSMGLSMVTIGTDKGEDMPDNVKPLTDPSRNPPPEGHLVHYDEEIEQAKGSPHRDHQHHQDGFAGRGRGQGDGCREGARRPEE